MDEKVQLYRIALTLVHGVGPTQHRELVSHYGSAEAVFGQTEKQLKADKVPSALAERICAPGLMDRAKRELDFVLKNNVRLFYYADSDYPYRLAECKDAPPLLYYRGNCNLNASKVLAFVGTRKMTDYGRQNIQSTISELASRHPDLLIVSGLAYGVDVCSHQAALDSSLNTVGVMGTGQDNIYPRVHANIAKQMMLQGGLLTEYPTLQNDKIDKGNFVARNRVIAGLSDAVVVAESALKGGALLTADFANSYSRDVFTYPGRVNDTYSSGCNMLIRTNKAALITGAKDIEEMMNWQTEEPKTGKQSSLFPELTENNLTDDEKTVIRLLREAEQMQLNDLSLQMNMPVWKLSSLLFQMEFKQLVHQLPGGIYAVGP